ncbi:hypothetical protein HPB52_010519 [Rhipicephalus sanguineus]|uniref:Uncharacterized protein n=1 Tax=Rhipicephalus sanguineus TaxID=34632 RepID=A0A9D4T9C5_RHISA|nr:hypothetical protein HPB52_010519 [Rhipicephalus sanguineus]
MKRVGWFRSFSYSPGVVPAPAAPCKGGTDPDDQTPSGSQGEPSVFTEWHVPLASRDGPGGGGGGGGGGRRQELLPPADLSPGGGGSSVPPLPSPGNKRRGTFRFASSVRISGGGDCPPSQRLFRAGEVGEEDEKCVADQGWEEKKKKRGS